MFRKLVSWIRDKITGSASEEIDSISADPLGYCKWISRAEEGTLSGTLPVMIPGPFVSSRVIGDIVGILVGSVIFSALTTGRVDVHYSIRYPKHAILKLDPYKCRISKHHRRSFTCRGLSTRSTLKQLGWRIVTIS